MTAVKRKVCLLTDHHISVNPRVWKEAIFFEKEGFEVVIINMWQSNQLLEKDLKILYGHNIDYKPYLNLIPGEVKDFKRFFYRVRKRLGSELQRFFKLGTRYAISHAPELMYKHAMAESADLYCAHLECAFFVGRNLVKQKKNVAFDFEDWYSRDYLVGSRPVKLLASIENFALLHGLYCTTTSHAMADALVKNFNVGKPLAVIYNAFPESDSQPAVEIENLLQPNKKVKLLWFSRTIGSGRGLEQLLKILSILSATVELHLLGNLDPDFSNKLPNIFPFDAGHKLEIHSFMDQSKLQHFISQFSIGLAIEEDINDNKNLTVSNKILQYIQAGIPVIASSTRGQQEIAGHFPKTVRAINIHNFNDWNDAVNDLTAIKEEDKREQKEIYERVFSWKVQESKLKSVLDQHL